MSGAPEDLEIANVREKLAKRQLFGKKSETVDPAQVELAFGPVLDALEQARDHRARATGAHAPGRRRS